MAWFAAHVGFVSTFAHRMPSNFTRQESARPLNDMEKCTVLLGLLALLCFPPVLLAQVSEEEEKEGFVPIFNGKNLTDWDGDQNIWRVESGVIIGQTSSEGPAKLSYNSFLIWTGGEVEDFVLRFDIKLSPDGNSGMQYRSWRLDGDQPFRVQGYQADFDGQHIYSGILYGEGFGGILCPRGQETVIEEDRKPSTVRKYAENDGLKAEMKVGDWNSYEITAKDFTFMNKINGRMTSLCQDEDKDQRRASGILAIQAHVGPPMKVEIKNIRLKKIDKNEK